MRVAPIGIACSGTPEGPRKAFQLGVAAAAITHGHPTGQLAAGALAMMIANLVDGHTLGQALANAHLVLSEQPASEETTSALQNAMRLAASEPNSPKAVSALGEGWIAEEALGIAVYCALSAPDLPSALFLAINHDGDSDSTGSITGNLVGCLYGQASIPKAFLQQLELRSVIEQIAEDLERLSEQPRSCMFNALQITASHR
jgi:ADP-ribosylglycohydrolase